VYAVTVLHVMASEESSRFPWDVGSVTSTLGARALGTAANCSIPTYSLPSLSLPTPTRTLHHTPRETRMCIIACESAPLIWCRVLRVGVRSLLHLSIVRRPSAVQVASKSEISDPAILSTF